MRQTLAIEPLSRPVDAEIGVPGSKSYTNRALIVSALSEGRTRVCGALSSEDTSMMIGALRALGIRVKEESDTCFVVDGAGGRVPADRADLFIGNSGTAARFLTALLGLGHGTYTVDGVERMRQRPIQDLIDGLSQLGVDVSSVGGNGCPPVQVKASGIRGGLTRMAGDRSSQYFTAILLVAPYAHESVELRVTGNLVSRPYVDMTLDMMARCGVVVQNEDYRAFRVAAGQRYEPGTIRVEPDASNASYFLAAAALSGGRVRVNGLGTRSVQGDVRFADVLGRMGCRVTANEQWIEVQGPEQLSGIDVDLNDMPDMAQTLCALAPFADGPVNIRNVATLRIKETDRIAALAAELGKLGVRVEPRNDGLTVYPASDLHGALIETYDDHRMAMSFSLIGLRVPGIVIQDPGCVRKTFPGFYKTLDGIRPVKA